MVAVELEYDVFLCHSKEDANKAESLTRLLEEAGLTVFRDRNIAIGARFADVIRQSIAKSRCLVVLWSKAASRSEWIGIELDTALEHDRPVLPVLLDHTRPRRELRELNGARMQAWYADDRRFPEYLRLQDTLLQLVGSTDAAVPRGWWEEDEEIRKQLVFRGVVVGIVANVGILTFLVAITSWVDRRGLEAKAGLPVAVTEVYAAVSLALAAAFALGAVILFRAMAPAAPRRPRHGHG